MIRPVILVPEATDGLRPDLLPSFPTSPGDGREWILDVLRAGGLRFRAGARWRSVL
ncbi:hypothetical protein ABZ807_29450 [Micromonospora sp. NPDC047548]|uniref:hypothetical protein n=1 Tax=Micromonospora sp. NPDC047548 TaxID=3155624 RepID=UPI0033ED2527